MIKVAAYCRVSTDREDQANSLESQKKYFARYIEQNPLWEMGEMYVDDGDIIGLIIWFLKILDKTF